MATLSRSQPGAWPVDDGDDAACLLLDRDRIAVDHRAAVFRRTMIVRHLTVGDPFGPPAADDQLSVVAAGRVGVLDEKVAEVRTGDLEDGAAEGAGCAADQRAR